MSFYNMINGISPLTFFLIPMLGDKHPDDYPRFRNVFTGDEEHPEYDGMIHVYTRVGGNNRGNGYGEEELYKHPNFVTSFDDSFDNTYATYVFSVPDEWKKDFQVINDDKIGPEDPDISDKLKAQIDKVFPKLQGKLWWHEQKEEVNGNNV